MPTKLPMANDFITRLWDNVEEFVFIAAITCDHYLESKDAIASIRTHHHGYRVILYDLELKDDEI